MPRPQRRHLPVYPVLGALALGGALASGCGPDFDVDQPLAQDQQNVMRAVDAGTPTPPPNPNDFIGGGAPYEALEDAGVVR